MFRKSVYVLFMVLLLFLSIDGFGRFRTVARPDSNTASNEELRAVNPDEIWVPDNHTSIQTAINVAADGDSIHVRASLYIENVVVNKSVLLFGESRESVIDGNKTENVIRIMADNVTISGFTLKNSSLNGIYASECTNVTITNNNFVENARGILFENSSSNLIEGNNITTNDYGIVLHESSNNNILRNEITKNVYFGIELYASSNNSVSHNVIENNHYGVDIFRSSKNNVISENYITNNDDGVHLYLSPANNTISGNNITNSDRGIWSRFASNNSISRNNIAHNYYGIEFDFSFNVTILENNITDNGPYGVWFRFCSNNSVCGNSVTENQQEGISLYNSSNIAIFGNNITNNNKGIGLVWSFNNVVSENNLITNNCGIEFYESSSNKLYHNNLITNTQQSCISTSGYANSWDNGVEGNYWSDYTGIDTNKDGIGDAPYAIDTENRDNYPLMNPYLPGDCDHDGIVNIKDATKIGIAWNTTKGMPNYNPHADLNMDETINTADAEITRKNWQKTSKPP